MAFLTPKFDPSVELDTQANEMEEGPSLPMKNDEEFKPFIRRLPEFKFWYGLYIIGILDTRKLIHIIGTLLPRQPLFLSFVP